MKISSITRGRSSGEAEMLKAIFLVGFALYSLWWGVSETKWLVIVSGLIATVAGINSIRTWLAYKRGNWQIHWMDSRLQILEQDNPVYDGELVDLHRIEQDGRGYHLYTTPRSVYRLLRKDASVELEDALNENEEAEQVGDGDAEEAV